MTKKKEFWVFFSQVNQARFKVDAIDEKTAILKAARLWREEHGDPTGACVEMPATKEGR